MIALDNKIKTSYYVINMKKLTKISTYLGGLSAYLFVAANGVFAETITPIRVSSGVAVPDLSRLLSFMIKIFFSIAAIVALLYLLLGALSWITSGGSKEAVDKAQQKIQAAVIGLIVIAAVLAIAVTLEKYVFQEQICFGLTCDIKIPRLLGPKPTCQPGLEDLCN